MARKPNYDFERREREKAKAAKTAEKLALRKAEKEKAEADRAAGIVGETAPKADGE
jgi:hypothetical protein